MKTRPIGIALACAALLASPLAMADHRMDRGPDHRARGRVLEVQPLYETVTTGGRPQEHCWEERVPNGPPGGEVAPTVAGAVVGGVIGNQIGKGSGRDAATVAGALLGGAVANQMAQPRHPPGFHMERRCETVGHPVRHEEVVGYRVKYEYRGQVDWTRTRERPGRFIDLDVDVRPSHHQ